MARARRRACIVIGAVVAGLSGCSRGAAPWRAPVQDDTQEKLANLMKRLQDPDDFVCRDVAPELGEMGTKARPAVPLLVKCLDLKNGDDSISVVSALGLIGDPAAVDPLRRLLKNPGDGMRWEAAHALSQIGAGAVGAVPDLIAVASEEDPDRYPHSPNEATDALTRIGLPAAPALVNALADERTTAFAGFALGRMGPTVIPTLTAALRRDRATAAGAARAASYLGAAGAPMVGDLVNALRERRIETQEFAFAMEGIGSGAGDAVPQLIELLEDENPFTRQTAASTLAAIGSRARSAAPALRKALEKEGASGAGRKMQEALRRIEE